MEDESERERMDRFRREAGHASQVPKSRWHRSLEHAADLWQRYTAGSGWQKSRFAIAASLIVGVVIVAIYLLATNAASGGNGDQDIAVVGARPTSTAARPSPSATATASTVPTLASKPTARRDCDAIRGTNYTSDAERTFFRDNCVTPTVGAVNPEDGQGGTLNTPTPRPPTQPPAPEDVSADDAINLAVSWITHDAPESYRTDAQLCNSVSRADRWLVTCTASLTGCQGSVCQATLSVCVLADPLEVRPADQC